MATIAHETSSVLKPRRPRRLHYPSFAPSGDLATGSPPELGVLQSPGSTRRNANSLSPLSRSSAAVLGMRNVSPETRAVLLQLSPAMLSRLETELERHDPRRTGTVELELFQKALSAARIPCSAAATEDIVVSYALDNQKANLWWAAFLREVHTLRDNKGALDRSVSPEVYQRPWEHQSPPVGGGVAGVAAPYFDYSSNPLDSPAPSVIAFSPEAEQLLTELAVFFRSRRVDVANAFEDFEMPGRFCKRVRRVTKYQFKEAVYFLAKGLAGLTEEHVALLCDVFDDGLGLVRYREFVRAVDLALDKPGGAGAIPHAADSCPPKTATLRGGSSSPVRRSSSFTGSIRSDDSMLSPGSLNSFSSLQEDSGLWQQRSPIAPALLPMTEEFARKTTKLLGVQSMGPMACHSPTRIASMQRLRGEDILARIREKLKIFNILLIDHLKLTDKHAEGCITANNFRRQMDQLRVFKLTADEFGALERIYQVKVGPEFRFNYREFCSDLQPMGPDIAERVAALPRDDTQTSPLAVHIMSEDEERTVNGVMRRVAELVRHKRLIIRSFFADFDRTERTRHGTTPHNYTAFPGCVSRAQFQQGLEKTQLSHLVNPSALALILQKYDRGGDFNILTFLRDLEKMETEQEEEQEALKHRRDAH
eukprot:Tamp_07852.p1 GENE.Tamp_07852~~Tamp_07852.p1  ORF type:complete len:669 (+),score=108.86 Tamp_07852:58-2007(+)